MGWFSDEAQHTRFVGKVGQASYFLCVDAVARTRESLFKLERHTAVDVDATLDLPKRTTPECHRRKNVSKHKVTTESKELLEEVLHRRPHGLLLCCGCRALTTAR